MLLSVHDDSGRPLKAHFSAQTTAGDLQVTIESRGGAIDSAGERNADYGPAFILLIRRIAALGFMILDARVESDVLIRRGLDPAQRRLRSEGLTYPLDPRSNPDAIAQALRKA
ncbi:MAG: hypothetical protein RJA99_3314 [Pseudomonadota bacterium]|jgi:hypothetical protein